MKLAEVFKLAAERIETGRNHYCCAAIAHVMLGRPIDINDDLYRIKAVQRFLVLATPERFVPTAPDYAAISNDMMGRIKDVASKLIGSKNDEQAYQGESRMRVELLLKVAALPEAQKEGA